VSHYTRLNVCEREEISRMLSIGHSQREIAKQLNRMPSTICREISRNVCFPGMYRAVVSERRSQRLKHQAKKLRKLSQYPKLRHEVFKLLRKRWSPEQIAKYLSQAYANQPNMNVSHESIYTYLYVLLTSPP
jgi:transposase, IS30 family